MERWLVHVTAVAGIYVNAADEEEAKDIALGTLKLGRFRVRDMHAERLDAQGNPLLLSVVNKPGVTQ